MSGNCCAFQITKHLIKYWEQNQTHNMKRQKHINKFIMLLYFYVVDAAFTGNAVKEGEKKTKPPPSHDNRKLSWEKYQLTALFPNLSGQFFPPL